MKRLPEIQQWFEARQDLAYGLIRVYLGVALFIRGAIMAADGSAISELAAQQNASWALPYIIAAHLAGGAMLAAGLLTRLAALIQIPVLLGAVLIVHSGEGLASGGQSLELSALVLFLLVIFLLFGPGPFAADRYIKTPALAPRWLEDRCDLAYSLIRVYLGVALFIRGWIFIGDSTAIVELAERQNVDWLFALALMHYIVAVHLLGGPLIALGLLTRLAALVQIPVLVGAVFVVHIEEGLLAAGQSLELSALTLFLLVVFFLFGSRSYGLDGYVAAEEALEPAPSHPELEGAAAIHPSLHTRPWPSRSEGASMEALSGGTTSTAVAEAPAVARIPFTAPSRRVVRRRAGIGIYLISFVCALPVFVYRGFAMAFEPHAIGASRMIVVADWVLTYFLLPFFLVFVATWVVARLINPPRK